MPDTDHVDTKIFPLSREEILSFTDYFCGKRDLILIDERSYVKNQKSITVDTINSIDTIFQTGINIEADEAELDWCREQWDKFARKIKAECQDYLRSDKEEIQKYYFRKGSIDSSITDDDARFLRFIEENRRDLYEDDLYESLEAIAYFVRNWCVVSRYTDNKHMDLVYNVLVDQKEKLTDLGVKVIILDGTADLSYEYRDDYFDIRHDPSFKRPLDHLKIHVVHEETSRRHLKDKDPKQVAEDLYTFLGRKSRSIPRIVVFTYKAKEDLSNRKINKDQLEDELKKRFDVIDKDGKVVQKNVDHFGNIKGKNTYNDSTFIAQYGLYRFPPVCYLLYYLSSKEEIIEELSRATTEEASAKLLELVKNSEELDAIMNAELCSDIEQNFFRSAIRSSSNTHDVDFWLFCNTDTYKNLLTLMERRYSPLHATMEYEEKPTEFIKSDVANRKTQKLSKPAIFQQFLNNLSPNTEFTMKQLREKTGLTPKEISNIKGRYPELVKLLEKWRKDKDTFRKPRDYNRHLNGVGRRS